MQMLLFISGMSRQIWMFPGIQIFLPLEGIVTCTTVASLVTYAFTTNKALKWSNMKKEKEKEKEEDTNGGDDHVDTPEAPSS